MDAPWLMDVALVAVLVAIFVAVDVLGFVWCCLCCVLSLCKVSITLSLLVLCFVDVSSFLLLLYVLSLARFCICAWL